MSDRYTHATWLSAALNQKKLKKLIRRAAPRIKKFRKKHPFDAIAFTGMSGTLVAPVISYELDIPLIMVRKSCHDSADCHNVSGYGSASRYVILDDLVSSGKTLRNIYQQVSHFYSYSLYSNSSPDLVGIMLYSTNDCSCCDLDITPRSIYGTLRNWLSPTGGQLPALKLD